MLNKHVKQVIKDISEFDLIFFNTPLIPFRSMFLSLLFGGALLKKDFIIDLYLVISRLRLSHLSKQLKENTDVTDVKNELNRKT